MTNIYQPIEIYKFFEQQGRYYKIPKGQVFQSTDTRQVFNLIKSGYVKRYNIANDGTIKVQGIWVPGDIFPLTIAFSILFGRNIYESPEIYHYQTMTPVEIYSLDEVKLTQGLRENPKLIKDLLYEAGKRIQSNVQRLENLGLKTSYHKLAHQLLYFANENGVKTTGGVKITIPLSHQDIADNLSVTRETVSASMKELREKGLITTRPSSRLIIVPDLKKLENEAYN